MTPFSLFLIAASPLIGSFLATATVRLPAGEPLLLARSRCRTCARPLGPRDLLPLVSWLARGGRCACRNVRLSLGYPAFELAATAIGLAGVLLLDGPAMPVGVLLGWTLLLLAGLDLKAYWLPEWLTLPLIAAGLVFAAMDDRLPAALAGAMLGFAVPAGLAVLFRRWRGYDGMGLGDALLLAAAGAWLGWRSLPALVLIACLLGLLLAVWQRRRRPEEPRIAFGACIAPVLWLAWLNEQSGGSMIDLAPA